MGTVVHRNILNIISQPYRKQHLRLVFPNLLSPSACVLQICPAPRLRNSVDGASISPALFYEMVIKLLTKPQITPYGQSLSSHLLQKTRQKPLNHLKIVTGRSLTSAQVKVVRLAEGNCLQKKHTKHARKYDVMTEPFLPAGVIKGFYCASCLNLMSDVSLAYVRLITRI